MKKLYIAICFIAASLNSTQAFAAARELRDQIEMQQSNSNQNRPQMTVDDPSIPKDPDAFIDYVRERAKKAIVTPMEMVENGSTMSAIKSEEYIASQSQNDKSTFQKMYEEALAKLDNNAQEKPGDIIAYTYPALSPTEKKQQQQAWEKLDFDVVNVTLPNNQKVLAPAKEHIPYLLSRIEILPNGMVKIKEVLTVVANGEKLKHGLSKALPKYSISRSGVKNRTIPYLNSVKINGKEIDYQIKDNQDRYLIAPKEKFYLNPGVYTYEFEYLLDRKLWYYDDFNEFYWDVTGSFWNLVISQAVATVWLPANIDATGQTIFVGYSPNNLTKDNTVVTKDAATKALGFTSLMPLLPGEGMHILVSIPKKGFFTPNLDKKFEWFIEDFGDIIFAIAGFAAILIAYLISWKYITNENLPNKIGMQRNPAMLRLLAKGTFDKTSFMAFLLDMYRRNIIDIREDEQKVTLTRKTNDLSRLNKNERKAIEQIFRNDTAITLSSQNISRLRKAYNFAEKDTNGRLKFLSLKLNSGYILFSAGMLILSEAAMAYLSVNPWHFFATVFASTVTAAFYIWVFMNKFNKKWLNITAKIFSAIMLITATVMLCFYIHIISSIMILAMIYVIFVYSSLFSKRNGLIRSNIIEAQDFAKYLKNNASTILLGNDFKNQQANIYALEETANYPKQPQIEAIYKLDIIEKIKSLI